VFEVQLPKNLARHLPLRHEAHRYATGDDSGVVQALVCSPEIARGALVERMDVRQQVRAESLPPAPFAKRSDQVRKNSAGFLLVHLGGESRRVVCSERLNSIRRFPMGSKV